MNLTEKAAYILGLADGLELDTDKKEARIIKEMLELLTEMADTVEDIDADLTDLCEAVEEIDEDLSFVEQEVFGEIYEDFGEDEYEITCPACKEVVVLSEDMLLGGDVSCPACGEKIEIEIDSCDCGCGHDHD